MTANLTTVELVHAAILRDAAEIANSQVDQTKKNPSTGRFRPEKRHAFGGQVFRADQIRSRKGGLALSIEEGIVSTLTKEEINNLRQIGQAAIQQAISKNQRAFVGMIVGEAREGRNYFDRYK